MATRRRDWNALAALMRADPKNKFSTKEEVRDYTQRTYERAYAAGSKMVLTPPVGKVKLEPFPDYQQESAPGGQYLPAAEDGSRPATYYYRNVPKDLYVASLQNVILHETLPGHHLQIALLAEHGRKDNHPISRLLFFSGPGEGWATYAEDFAHEIGLYDSDRDYIGRMMGSITPMMVADLGMQVKGWSAEKATEYLKEAMPMRPPERAAQSVAHDQRPARVRAGLSVGRNRVGKDARSRGGGDGREIRRAGVSPDGAGGRDAAVRGVE